MRELVIVTARQYCSGAPCVHAALLQLENDLWSFSDPDAKCIWDAVEDEDAPVTLFSMNTLHVEFEFIPNPFYIREGDYRSHLQEGIEGHGANIVILNPDALFDTVKRHIADADAVCFMGMFEMESALDVTFLGILDLDKVLL